MQRTTQPFALYDKAICIAEDQALFGDDELLQRLQLMNPQSLKPRDVRVIEKACNEQVRAAR